MPNEFRDDEDPNRRAGVTLRKGVPVYLVYLTAFERDGQMAFRDDIYDRDARLIRALERSSRTR
jgi:murein L,D-transpeptidase YcbB/YkuD